MVSLRTIQYILIGISNSPRKIDFHVMLFNFNLALHIRYAQGVKFKEDQTSLIIPGLNVVSRSSTVLQRIGDSPENLLRTYHEVDQ